MGSRSTQSSSLWYADAMNKVLTWIVVGMVIVAGGIYVSNKSLPQGEEADISVGQAAEFIGTVVSVDTSQAMVDGPYVLELRSKAGAAVTVKVPSMGLPLCAAYKANHIGDVTLIKVGDEFEVRGMIGEDGAITPCASADDYLRPTPLIVEDFEGEADPLYMMLAMKPWHWVSAQYSDGRTMVPKVAGAFTVTFTQNGARFSVATDCNSGGGSYALASDNTIVLSRMMSTQMYCEGSQESEFFKLLSQVQKYHFTSKGELIFDLKFDSGTMIFR